jgi:steroid delta-isomerase-like uncharacterized protein
MEAQMRRLYSEVFEKGNVEVVDEFCAPDMVEHEDLPGVTASGVEGTKQFFQMWQQGVSDTRIDVHDLLVDGDKLAARVTVHGTHTGDLMGIPATGKSFSMQVIDIVRFKDGKAAEHWGINDGMAMMQQLGLVP